MTAVPPGTALLLCAPLAHSYEWNEREDRGLNHGHDVVIAAPRLGLFTAIPVRVGRPSGCSGTRVDHPWRAWKLTRMRGLGVWRRPQILNVAFCAAYNAPRYYQELRDRSVKKVRCAWLGLWGPRMTPLVTYIAALTPSVPWLPRACRLAGAAQFAWVVITALTFCFLVYGSMAITGCAPLPCLARPTLSRIVSCRCCGLRCGVGPRYLTFGKNTNSDLLTNYGTDITIVLITRFVLTFVVIFT